LKIFYPLFIFFFALCPLLHAPCSFAEEPLLVFSYPPGATSQNPGTGEAGIHRITAGIYNEAWTFEGYTASGEIVRAAGGISEAFPWGNKPFVGASLVSPGGEMEQFHLWLDPESFRAASDRLDLSLGTGFFREAGVSPAGFPRFEIQGRAQGFGLALSVECLAPAWQPPGEGRLVFGKEKKSCWDISVPCPRARFEGTAFTSRGEKKVSGFGYIDHTYSNIRILEFARRLISYRVHLPEFSLNFLEIETTPKFGGRPIEILVLADGRRVRYFPLVKVIKQNYARDEQNKYEYPQTLKITGEDGPDRIEITLKVKRFLNSSDGLANLNRAERAIVKMLGIRPVGYSLAHEAVIFLTLGGKTRELTSSSFHSMLILD
jgi:hypothetical protein